ncbi:hypothetical protein ABFS82_10G002000 [Erythranthe guttata]|nr:PREDICTED: myosin-1 [Erythranthe guttata]|eukprot:XP_012832284.1 PREDICTED: myosin-1 [Erythranthe guttata]
MEEDKKKKKNRKKKNKQATKPIESVTLDVGAGQSTSNGQIHDPEIEQNNNNGQVSGIVNETNDVGGDLLANRDEPLANGTRGANLAQVEKQYWLDREASFQDKIKELQAEKDARIEKEASTEERIKQLLKEKDKISQEELAGQKENIKQLHDEKNAFMQNEASLKEKLVQLEKEIGALILKEASLETEVQHLKDEQDSWKQKEASLKEKLVHLEKENDALILREGSFQHKIQQIQGEIDAHLQKEASLATEIQQLKDEKDSWMQKEADFKAKNNQLVDEAAVLHLKMVNLQEKITQMERERDAWVLKEDSAKESIASLTNDNTNLRALVMDLEQSRESLLEETQHLTQIISSLKLQNKNLDTTADFPHSSMDNKVTSEDGEVNYHIEDAREPVGESVAQNAELVDKVNELLYAELDQRGVAKEHFSSATSVPLAFTDIDNGSAALEPDLAVGAEASKVLQPISGSTQSLEDVMIEDQRNLELVNVSHSPGLANSSEIIEADEIVQIPLNEKEIKEPVLENDDKEGVGLTDAPLIGAPFRLISFFARYVTGADLVDKNTAKYG